MRKALAVLAVALVLLAGVFLVRKIADRNAAAPRHAHADMRPEAVVRLHVSYWGDSVTLVKEGERWVTSGDRFPADTARMRRVLGYLLGLQTREQVSRAASGRDGDLDLASYGLDDARARQVTWTLADGRSVQVQLGKVSGIDYGSSFWKPVGEAVVYRTPGTFVFEVSSRSQDWKDTALFRPFTSADIRSVAVTWRDSAGHSVHYALERAAGPRSGRGTDEEEYDTGYVLVGNGARLPARRADAARVFMHAAQFKVDEFVPGIDTAATAARRASLDDPSMTIRITLADGTVHDVIAGDVVHELYRYVKHPRHPDPVRVFVWRFDDFNKTAADFVRDE